MHVGSVLVFEGPTPDYDAFLAHIERGLHLVPRYRQKLAYPPLGVSRPRWVDDPHFNAGYHIRHTALPPPAGDDELRRLAGRVFSQQLDREKPLWEIWLVDGIADGRFALICKTHHALVDGISGVDILTVLFDLEPDPPEPEPGPKWAPRPPPSGAEMLAESLAERVTSPLKLVRDALSRPDKAGADAGRAAAGLASQLAAGIAGAPAEPAQHPDRPAPPVRLGRGRPGHLQGHQGRARRHDQRRRPDRRRRRAESPPAPPRPRPRGPGAQGDGADQRPRRRGPRRARQPGRRDVRAAPGRARGSGRALPLRARTRWPG